MMINRILLEWIDWSWKTPVVKMIWMLGYTPTKWQELINILDFESDPLWAFCLVESQSNSLFPKWRIVYDRYLISALVYVMLNYPDSFEQKAPYEQLLKMLWYIKWALVITMKIDYNTYKQKFQRRLEKWEFSKNDERLFYDEDYFNRSIKAYCDVVSLLSKINNEHWLWIKFINMDTSFIPDKLLRLKDKIVDCFQNGINFMSIFKKRQTRNSLSWKVI